MSKGLKLKSRNDDDPGLLVQPPEGSGRGLLDPGRSTVLSKAILEERDRSD